MTLVAPIATFVVLLGADGRVTSRGTMGEVLNRNPGLRMIAIAEKNEPAKNEVPLSEQPDKSGKLVATEEIALGHVAWSALRMYFNSFGGAGLWSTVIIGVMLNSALNVLQPWYLGEWARQYEHKPASEVSISL